MTGLENLPGIVREKLTKLSSVLAVPVDSLLAEYLEWYEKVSQDVQFENDSERHTFAIRAFYAWRIARPPTRKIGFIVIGYSEEKKLRNGDRMSRIYGFYSMDGKEWRMGVIVARGDEAGLWRDVELFSKYTVRVSPGRGNTFWAVPETRFDNPEDIGLTPRAKVEFLKRLGVKGFTLKDVYRNISERDENGYVNEFDLKGLYAFVLDYRSGERSDGSKWAQYIVSDDSIDTAGDVDEDGNVIPKRFTVWVPYSMMRYGRMSELFLYGTVTLGGDGVPQMNAIGVVPIVPKPLVEEDEM